MARRKQTVLAEVVIKGKKVPDFGMGRGVLLQEEITFSDPQKHGFDSAIFKARLLDEEDRLMREVVEVRFTVKEAT